MHADQTKSNQRTTTIESKDQLLKIAEAAQRLACSTRSCWRLISSGALPVMRMPYGTRVRERDVEALIAKAAGKGSN